MSNHSLWYQLDLQCKPLDSLKDIQSFILDPPSWRTLCEGLRPHSKYLIKNSEVNYNFDDITLERPQNFCHFDPDKEEVIRHHEDHLPRTLVCHDMANGYHDDSAIDGTGNHNAYTFYNWAAVDIFCYFSHHLITIPPLGWINVAHAHGVKVIGTIITEWSEGALFWNQVLGSELETQNLVSALVTIAKTLKFEGWLLNVENKVSEPERLVQFVQMLHRTLHAELPGAELIWYDSVINDGSLSWQNKLNHKNKQFFDVCDGFFVNYSWSEEDVRESVATAGERRRYVYVGIDVWGRNFYGGGQFNTQEAVKLLHKLGCSLAIFAPAWTFEALGPDGDPCDPHALQAAEPLARLQRLLLRDRALWDSLWPYLNTRPPCQLPFHTSFCRGQGKKRRMYGEVLCNASWYNLRHMQYQPNSSHGAHCYLLSTAERLRSASRLAVRDVRGILKLRDSLMDLNFLELLDYERRANESADELETRQASSDLITDQLEDQSKDESKDQSNDESKDQLKEQSAVQSTDLLKCQSTDQTKDQSTELSLKSTAAGSSDEALHKPGKFKNVFKNILKIKKTKVEFKEQSSIVEVQEVPAEENQELQEGAERSCIQLSPDLRIHLQHDDRTRLTLAYVSEESDCLEPYFEDSYNGGSCLKVHPSDDVYEAHRTIRLFHCDFYVKDSLVVCMVTKPVVGYSRQSLTLWLGGRDAAGQRRRAALVGRRLNQPSPPPSPGVVTRYPERPGTEEFKALQTHLVLNEPGFYMPVQNHYGWQVFYFVVKLAGCRVTSMYVRPADCQGPVLLGHVGLCAWHEPPPRPGLASTEDAV